MPRLTSRPLTQKLIDSTPLPARGYTSLRDHEQRGLEVRIWSTGTRSRRFEYLSPVTGKKAVLSLPAGTLAEARVIAKSHRALVALVAILLSKPRRTSKPGARRTQKP